MTPADLCRFIEGLLAAWSVAAEVTAAEIPGGVEARIARASAPDILAKRTHTPAGIIWEVQAMGERARVHASAQGAIRSLGGHLAPERPAARVLFVSAGAAAE